MSSIEKDYVREKSEFGKKSGFEHFIIFVKVLHVLQMRINLGKK